MILFLIAFSAVLFFLSVSPLLPPLFCAEPVGFPAGILRIVRLQQSARDWASFTLAKTFINAQKLRRSRINNVRADFTPANCDDFYCCDCGCFGLVYW